MKTPKTTESVVIKVKLPKKDHDALKKIATNDYRTLHSLVLKILGSYVSGFSKQL